MIAPERCSVRRPGAWPALGAALLVLVAPTAAARGIPVASPSAKPGRGWLGRANAWSAGAQPGNLILVRNGLPDWGLPEEQFIGWADPDLSEEGQMQVRSAARLLVESGFTIDVVHTSQVRRRRRRVGASLRQWIQWETGLAPDQYSKRMAAGEWGGQIELFLLARGLDTPIQVRARSMKATLPFVNFTHCTHSEHPFSRTRWDGAQMGSAVSRKNDARMLFN